MDCIYRQVYGLQNKDFRLVQFVWYLLRIFMKQRTIYVIMMNL